jgi:beta-mannosidase
MVFTRAFELTPAQKRSTVFYCSLLKDGKKVAECTATFAPSKHLDLADPRLNVAVHQEADQAVIDIAAQSLARFVELKLNGAEVVFSDNYFDVLPGQGMQVRCTIPSGWNVEQLRGALNVTSLYQSF